MDLDGLELWDIIKEEKSPRKKDLQVLPIMFITISKKIMHELDVEKIAKKTWNSLKTKSGGITHVRKFRLQSPKRDYENLIMEDVEVILE